jgi:acyl-coenzyme A synthetase/AMP-(fatty) acid ligase
VIYYKKYYYAILKNLRTKYNFYNYYSKSFSYSDSLLYSLKILQFIKKNNLRKKIILTFSNKSFEMYSSIFPILISGNTWVPLSINLPLDKIKNILQQISPDLCIHDNCNPEIIRFLEKKVKCLKFKDIKTNSKVKVSVLNEIKNLDINATAFIYFTSGSTGLPKGIRVSHKNIISDVYEQKKYLYKNNIKNLIFGDYYDTAFSIFFDIFFPAIFFRSTISPSITKSDNYYLLDHYKKNNINTLVAVPSTFGRIVEVLNNSNKKLSGKNLIVTGEPFYLNFLEFLYKKTDFKRIFNCYGGTEMGNWVFYHECSKKDLKKYKKYNLVPIGKPFGTVSAKIKKNQLIVSGPMITQGYVNKKLNKNKFIFRKKNIFFTGDKVKKINSIYICKGRSDKMVKINGYRIEIPDVEANFRKLDYIKDVIVFEKKSKDYKNYLIAITSLLKQKSENQIRKDLQIFLSLYMIPRKIYIIDSLPKNSNGKLDRAGMIKKFN